MDQPTIIIVEAPFYPEISAQLLAGANAVLQENNCHTESVQVPGALEIPPAIAVIAATREVAGFVALGCVIRGETSHYDIVAGESARALMDLGTNRNLAIGNGILTVDNKQQAMVRADVAGKNKGGDAARACLRLIELKSGLKVCHDA